MGCFAGNGAFAVARGGSVYRKSARPAKAGACRVRYFDAFWNGKFPALLKIDNMFSLLNLDFCSDGVRLHNLLIAPVIFPVVNQWLPDEFLSAKSDQENSCVRHKLSPCVEMLM
jgi:hypothetical protein